MVRRCLRKHPALLSSSQFKGRHASKFLQPYPSQVQLFKAVARPGPQLVLLRSPPDTGKTSLAPALPELFPEHRVVFCCLARRVNLEVAQTLYNMGIPFAWIHNSLITCSWLCGLRGASTSKSVRHRDASRTGRLMHVLRPTRLLTPLLLPLHRMVVGGEGRASRRSHRRRRRLRRVV